MEKTEGKTDAPGQNKVYDIIVNTRPKTWDKKEISFREVVLLAFPSAVFNEQHIYTVTYSKGEDKKPKGPMTENSGPVHVKDGMVFDVEHNDIS
jgi:hypothetical protein